MSCARANSVWIAVAALAVALMTHPTVADGGFVGHVTPSVLTFTFDDFAAGVAGVVGQPVSTISVVFLDPVGRAVYFTTSLAATSNALAAATPAQLAAMNLTSIELATTFPTAAPFATGAPIVPAAPAIPASGPADDFPCFAEWTGPSTSPSWEGCKSQSRWIAWARVHAIPVFITLVAAIVSFFACPVVFASRYCCQCCGGSKQRPGHVCYGGAEWDAKPQHEIDAAYSKTSIRLAKLACATVIVGCSAAGYFAYSGGNATADAFDKLSVVHDTILRWAMQIFTDAINIINGAAGTGMGSEVTEMRNKIVMLNEHEGSISGQQFDFPIAGKKGFREAVLTITNYFFVYPSFVAVFIVFTGGFWAVGEVRAYGPCCTASLSFIFAFVIGLLATVALTLDLASRTVCGELDLQLQRQPGLMQWYALPMCLEHGLQQWATPFIDQATSAVSSAGCSAIDAICSDTLVYTAGEGVLFYCGANLMTSCATSAVMATALAGLTLKAGAPVAACAGVNSSTTTCTVSDCAASCADATTKATADHAVRLYHDLVFLETAYNNVFVPHADCNKFIDQIIGFVKPFCNSLTDGTTQLGASVAACEAALILNIFVMFIGQKRFRSASSKRSVQRHLIDAEGHVVETNDDDDGNLQSVPLLASGKNVDKEARHRLVRYFVFNDPARFGDVDRLLLAYRGNEEGLFVMLTRKYGVDEPDEQETRRRLVRYMEVHNPAKVGNIEEILEAYGGRDDLMFEELQRKYGPLPPPPPRECDATLHLRVTRFLYFYNRDRVAHVDEILDGYAERPGDLMPALEAKYGPEQPVIDALDARRQRLQRYLSFYNPAKLDTVDEILQGYAARDDLFVALERKYGPEASIPPGYVVTPGHASLPPRFDTAGAQQATVMSAGSTAAAATFVTVVAAIPVPHAEPADKASVAARLRLRRFLYHYDRQRLAEIEGRLEVVLDGFRGQEDELFESLQRKYGPEQPVTDAVEAQRRRLRRYLSFYNPEKLDAVEEILDGYATRDDMFAALERKYGPESAVHDGRRDDGGDTAAPPQATCAQTPLVVERTRQAFESSEAPPTLIPAASQEREEIALVPDERTYQAVVPEDRREPPPPPSPQRPQHEDEARPSRNADDEEDLRIADVEPVGHDEVAVHPS